MTKTKKMPKEFAILSFSFRKPKPWKRGITKASQKQVGVGLVRIVRYLKCMNNKFSMQLDLSKKVEKSMVRKWVAKRSFPFLQRNLEMCVNNWYSYENKYKDWLQNNQSTHSRKLFEQPLTTNAENSNYYVETQDYDDNSNATAKKYIDEKDYDDEVLSEKDLESLSEEPNCLNQFSATNNSVALLKSFYTIYYINELGHKEHEDSIFDGDDTIFSQTRVEGFMDSSIIQRSVNRPPRGGLHLKCYSTARDLSHRSVMALERWRHAQKSCLLPKPETAEDLDSGAESETGLDLWNRRVAQLRCFAKHKDDSTAAKKTLNGYLGEKSLDWKKLNWANFDLPGDGDVFDAQIDTTKKGKTGATKRQSRVTELQHEDENLSRRLSIGAKQSEGKRSSVCSSPEIANLSFESVQSMPVLRTPFLLEQQKKNRRNRTKKDGHSGRQCSNFADIENEPPIQMAKDDFTILDDVKPPLKEVNANTRRILPLDYYDMTMSSPQTVNGDRTADVFATPSSTVPVCRQTRNSNRLTANSLTSKNFSTPDLFDAIQLNSISSTSLDKGDAEVSQRRLTRASLKTMATPDESTNFVVGSVNSTPLSSLRSNVKACRRETPRGTTFKVNGQMNAVRRSSRIQILSNAEKTHGV